MQWSKYWITAQTLRGEDARFKRFNGAVVYAPAKLENGGTVRVILETPGQYATTLDIPKRLLATWHQHVPGHRHCYCTGGQ